jgi:hypothetical protein
VDAQHDKHGLDEVALKAAQLARCQLRVLAILRIASANNRSIETPSVAMMAGEGRVRTKREARAHRFLRIISRRTKR